MFFKVDECIDSLNERHIISIRESHLGYWCVEMDKRDYDKTLLTTLHDLLNFVQISILLENASATFQVAMISFCALQIGSTRAYRLNFCFL